MSCRSRLGGISQKLVGTKVEGEEGIDLLALIICQAGAELSHPCHSLRLIRGHSLSAKGRNASSPRTVLRILTRSQGPVDSAGVLIWVKYMSCTIRPSSRR